MNRDEIYARWAPEGAPWSKWVKPVLFAHTADPPDPGVEPPRPRITVAELLPPDEPALDPYRQPAPMPSDVAVVVDLPGVKSVGAGLALAALGFQPVPLYNALPGPGDLRVHAHNAVDVWSLVRALVGSAKLLQPPRANAPPAFLLDANRHASNVVLSPTAFDNRSYANAGDFPSGDGLRERGIRRVVLLGKPLWDAAAILRRWQLPIAVSRDGVLQPLKISWWSEVNYLLDRMTFRWDGPSTG